MKVQNTKINKKLLHIKNNNDIIHLRKTKEDFRKMKKLLSVAILFMLVAMLSTTIVCAATSSNLANELYTIGSKYGMTSADKVKIERYLSDNPVTDEQANQVVAKANEAAKIMEEAGTTNVKDLSTAQKDKLKSIANEAANIVGLTLTFKADRVEIYKNGKLIETIGTDSGKLAYTGNNVNVVLVVSSIAVVALAAGVVIRKKFANV